MKIFYFLFLGKVLSESMETCILYILETAEDSAVPFVLNEVPFRDCSQNEILPTSASVINCDSSAGITSLIDSDHDTGYECTPVANLQPVTGVDDDAVPAVQFMFNPAQEIKGFDLITGTSSIGSVPNDGHPFKFRMDCYANSIALNLLSDPEQSNIDHETIGFAAVATGSAAKIRYTTMTGNFDGVFDDACLTAGGDPFIQTNLASGIKRQFWLPVGGQDAWTKVLQGPTVELWAHAFARPGTTEQWLDGLTIKSKQNGAPILSIQIPDNVPLGQVARESVDADLDFVQVAFDGLPVEHVTHGVEIVSKDGTVGVTVAKLHDKIILDEKLADSFWVRTNDFAFHTYTSQAQKHESDIQNTLFTHLNFKFSDLPRADSELSGFFYEAVYFEDGELSAESTILLTKPVQPYAAEL